MSASSLRWPLLALFGLVVAVAVAFLAARAVNTDIGISSEPPTAGRALSPAPPKVSRPKPGGNTTITAPPQTTTVTVPTPAAPTPSGGEHGESGDD